MKPAIAFEHVTGGYPRVPVFEDLSFAVAEGSMCAVIGPNGSGKTTLLKTATGLLAPARGAVRLFGENVRDLPAARRAQWVGVVPQQTDTPMAFTVAEIVMIGRTVALSRWKAPSARDAHIVEKAMTYTDVIDMRDRPFPELSAGEKQRVVIAMVLAQQPRLILMDEATSHLDINHRLEVMQIVERLNREQGVTVLMVSHDLSLSAEFSERLLLMDHGRLVADGRPGDVLTEETLRRVYHCDVRVRHDPVSGSVLVMPVSRLAPGRTGRGVRVHVIAGGGCGAEILRRLSLGDYTVTCGVLNQGDSDADVAAALELDAALEKPFSPIGDQALADGRRLAEQADVVVVCGVPFGTGNAVNLDLAEAARERGARVLLMDGVGERDYTPDRRATAAAARLARQGAEPWSSIADLLGLLPSAEQTVPHGAKHQGGSCKTPRGMGVPPMNHGQDARATLNGQGFCKSLKKE